MKGISCVYMLWIVFILDVRNSECQKTQTYEHVLQTAMRSIENNNLSSKDQQKRQGPSLSFLSEVSSGLERNVRMIFSDQSRIKSGNGNQQPTMMDHKKTPLEQEATQYNVSQKCQEQLRYLANGIANRTFWALSMLDSDFKPGAGFLRGSTVWLGDYDECVAVSAQDASGNGTYFDGKYCLGAISPTRPVTELQIVIGLCLPDGCSELDTAVVINKAINLLGPNVSLSANYVQCQETHKELSGRAIAAIVVMSIFGVLLLLGTGFDLYLVNFPPPQTRGENTPLLGPGKDVEDSVKLVKRKSGHLEEILLSFSMYSNSKKLLNTHQGKSSLRSIHGVRFLSMSWIILAHVLVFSMSLIGNMVDVLAWYQRWTFQAIGNGTLGVDTFFTISGLLLCYLTMNELEKTKGKLDWFMFYFHRYWRLTPPLALLMLLYIPLFEYWGDGPVWPKNGVEDNYCESTWWRNLLYIQNFFDDGMCMGWTWYLANDMQFFIISPLIFMPLFLFPALGFLSFSVFLLGTTIATGVISRVNHFAPNNAGGDDSFNMLYVKPWCRLGPYLIGMMTGYILHKTKSTFQIKWYVNCLCWALATAVALAVLYGLFDVQRGNVVLSSDVAALYNALNRTAWGASVSWLIFACCTGNGGFINTILSWEALIPLSRLTYMAYLVHPIVMYLVFYSRRTMYYITDIQYVMTFLGFLLGTYLIAFVLTAAFESPMIGLERVLLKRDKRN